MLEQNFTQYCKANKYPSDYDTMFEAQYNGSLGLAGHVSKHTIKSIRAEADRNRALNIQAHREYNQAILSGEVVDPSGEVARDGLVAAQRKQEEAVIEGKRVQLMSQISFIESLGGMSHRRNGNLKPSYQRTVDLYQAELLAL